MNIKQIKLENISAKKHVVKMLIIGEQQKRIGGKNQYLLFWGSKDNISKMKKEMIVFAILRIVGDHPKILVKRDKYVGYMIK